MNTKWFAIFGLGLIILAIIIFSTLYLARPKTPKASLQNENLINSSKSDKTSEILVTVDQNGFSPNSIAISLGTRVIWTNESEEKVSVNSDIYPTNALWPFLNLGSFDKDQRVSTVFKKAGVYTYHNQFKPEQKGTVTVK